MTDTAVSGTTLRLAIILGSVREGRFGTTVADWFTAQARAHGGFEVEVIDLAESELPLNMSRRDTPEAKRALERVSPKLAAADAFVVVTPEYNHSFPASLKNAIDWHRPEWRAKPVGFVSYGGMAGGLRAVEQLRQVFAELHAVTVRDSPSFHNVYERFDENGQPKDAESCSAAAKQMLGQLEWWGRALRTARAERPYAA